MDYHSDRFIDHSVMIYKNEKVVAVLPANSKGNQLYSHQGLTYGGLLLSRKLKTADTLELYKELLKYLESKEITILDIKQPPSFYTQLPCEEVEYLLHLTQSECYRVDTASVIDYRSKNEILSNRIEGVKKGQRNELIVKEETIFDDFWNTILIPNLEQKHQSKPTHNLEEIKELHHHFQKSIRQFNVYHKNKIVGGATIFETETTAHVQYISANEQKQELGTLDFLFQHLIEDIFVYKWYFDFGTSNEEAGYKLNKGLSYWKECFGARTLVHRFYKVDTKNHLLLNDVLI